MSDSFYDELDPGIRETVRLLNENGFTTTDSGDGESKLGKMAGVLPYPHVVIVCSHPSNMIDEAERAAEVLGDLWEIEASYNTRNKIAILMCQLYSLVVAEDMRVLGELENWTEEDFAENLRRQRERNGG